MRAEKARKREREHEEEREREREAKMQAILDFQAAERNEWEFTRKSERSIGEDNRYIGLWKAGGERTEAVALQRAFIMRARSV